MPFTNAVLALVSLTSFQSVPKSFEELELTKIRNYLGTNQFIEELRLETETPGEPKQIVRRTTYRDGKRLKIVIEAGNSKLEDVTDGLKRWVIVHGAKEYFEVPMEDFSEDPKKFLLKPEANRFQTSMGPGLPLMFACDPTPVLSGGKPEVVDGKTLRLVTAIGKSTDRTVTIKQWFMDGNWFLVKAEVDGKGPKGDSKVTAQVLNYNFKPEFSATEFVLNENRVPGYRKGDSGSIDRSRFFR
jgi:hypothetical protein